MSVRNLKRHYLSLVFSDFSCFYRWCITWNDEIYLVLSFTYWDLLTVSLKPKCHCKRYNIKTHLFPPILKFRLLSDNTLLKISSRTNTFWIWDFHTQSWTKFVAIFCSCLLHLKQKTWDFFFFSFQSLIVYTHCEPMAKKTSMSPFKLSGKAKKTGEMGNHYPETVLKLLQLFRDTGDKTTFRSSSCSRRSDGKTQKFV